MLVDIILNITYAVTSGFLGIIPDASFQTGIGTAIQNINGYLAGIAFIIPIGTLLSILGLFLTLEGILLTISIINWFIRKIPAVN